MRIIQARSIERVIRDLCVKANLYLRPDVLSALARAYRSERNGRPRRVLKAIIDNARLARRNGLAICQDTGMPVVFIEAGSGVHIDGDLNQAFKKGIAAGYQQAHLRNSIVASPLERATAGYTPGVLHLEQVRGSRVRVTVLPKGFGSENKSRLMMFNPTVSREQIKGFIVQAVKDAGANACPPFFVGVGIGGTADYACLLAKKALLRKVTSHQSPVRVFETDVLRSINKLNIGPMGLGGKTTALAVHIETYPTHIAGLPVAVNISCHALRSATKLI